MCAAHADAASPATSIDHVLAPGRDIGPAGGGIFTALAPDETASLYDRHAAHYDRLIGSPVYNRLIWGTRVADYRAFAGEAAASRDGPYLDVGCGTAVFTAETYRASTRPLVLVDRSRAMLSQAARRVGHAVLVQADLLDLPFAPRAFDTVSSFGVLHVLDDVRAALTVLKGLVAPGGTLFVSMLVADGGAISRPYMSALRSRGAINSVLTSRQLGDLAAEILGGHTELERRGAMAYLRA